ncbi:MAG: hypothetical protein HKP45_05030 [Winogradskyella sp.]|nr:hypothetical protein [Bacteroidia bacterium]NNF85389.1 hypothetical protein [Winogradskyella sp.]NNK40000.1 hypothetical protein [Winogradskyella sp.]
MLTNKILKIVLIVLSIGFIIVQSMQLEAEGTGLSAFMLILFTILYTRHVEQRNKYFFLFLFTFTVAHVMNFTSWLLPRNGFNGFDVFYYVTNMLYILSYVFLILRVAIEMNFKKIFDKFTIPIIILIILDIFCVSIITATTESKLSLTEYTLEFSYNAVIMALLSVALINYLNRDSNKAMIFLVGSVFIVFSEIIQLAYYYISDTKDLSTIYSTFLVLAFLFFFLQSGMKHSKPTESFLDDHANAA